MKEITFFASHPIQYQSALFRALSENCEFKVIYLSDHGRDGTVGYDVQFDKNISWGLNHQNGFHFEYLSFGQSLTGFFSPFISPFRLFKIVNAQSGIVIIHGWNRISLGFLVFFSALLRKRFIVRSENNNKLRRGFFKNYFSYFFLNFLALRGCCFWTIGWANRSYYEKYMLCKPKYLTDYYSVDSSWWADLDRENYSDGIIRFVFVGKFIEKKRPLRIIDHFSKIVSQEKIKAKLTMCGSGILKEKVGMYVEKMGIGESVSLMGFCDQPRVRQVLAGSHYLILDSEPSETWGLVVNEAIACGVFPLIGPDVGCREDVFGLILKGLDLEDELPLVLSLDIVQQFSYFRRREFAGCLQAVSNTLSSDLSSSRLLKGIRELEI